MTSTVAVLVSGGLDSAILTHELLGTSGRVQPIYVRFGLRWEAAELEGLRRFLRATPRKGLEPLAVLDESAADLYEPSHWSRDGGDVPGPESPDASVYLPGRNLLLLSKASVWCRLRGISTIAIGCLSGNPFPDASDTFFDHLEQTLAIGLAGGFRVIRPFRSLSKREVLRRGAGLPLSLTLSCLRPIDGRHCGACNKCAERQRAFEAIGLDDPSRPVALGSSA